MSALLHRPRTHVSLIQLDSVVLSVPQSNLNTVQLVLDTRAAIPDLEKTRWDRAAMARSGVAPRSCGMTTSRSLRLVSRQSGHRRIDQICVNSGPSAEAAQLQTFKPLGCMRTRDKCLHAVGMLGAWIFCLMTSAPSLCALFMADRSNSKAGVTSTWSRRCGDTVTYITGVSA